MTTEADMAQDEKVKARAYKIWEEAGCPEGKEFEHRKQAEQEILAEEARDAAPRVLKDLGKRAGADH